MAMGEDPRDGVYYVPYYQEQAAQFILDDYAGVIGGTTFA